jgi:hypothetical protein
MSFQRMDADTAETLAGVVRLLRRAAELVWAAVDTEGAGSPRQVLALGIDLAADEARNLLPDDIGVEGPVPVGLLAHDHCPRFAHLGTRLLRDRTRDGALICACGETRPREKGTRSWNC